MVEREFEKTFGEILRKIIFDGELHGLCKFFKNAGFCQKTCEVCPVNDYTDIDDLARNLIEG